MNDHEEGMLLRIFIGETDRHRGLALYEQIVRKARELHLAAVTVTRGIMGYGADSEIHTAKILRLSEDMPIIIEIIDTENNLEKNIALPRREYRGRLRYDGEGKNNKIQKVKKPQNRFK